MTHVDAADAALRAALQRVRKLPIAAAVFVVALLLALAVFFLARDAPKHDVLRVHPEGLSSYRHLQPELDYHPATSYLSPRENRAHLNALHRSNEQFQKSLRSPVARSGPPFTPRSPIAARSARQSPGYAMRTPRGTPLPLL